MGANSAVNEAAPPIPPNGLAAFDRLIVAHEQRAQQVQAELAELYQLILTLKQAREALVSGQTKLDTSHVAGD